MQDAARVHAHRATRLDDTVATTVVRLLSRRGWVARVEPATGYGTDGWARVLGRVVLAAPGTAVGEVAEDDTGPGAGAVRGWRSFFTAQVPHARVTVQIGTAAHQVTADRGGYIDVVLPCDLPPGTHEVTIRAGGRPVRAPVLVIGPEPATALLSDVDDTVMVTALPRPLLAAWNALVLHESARRVVPGMAGLYGRWLAEHPGAPVFYLSTGAWNVAPALRRFLGRHGYPAGPLLLTDWGPTADGWFRSGQRHKSESLARLMSELPQLRWVLVGDDGQHDPQLYGDVAAHHPGRVELVAIRSLSTTEQVLSHGTATPARDTSGRSSGPLVVHGADGNELALRLIDAGVLRGGSA